MNLTSLLPSLLTVLWRASWQASLLAIVVLIVQRILGNRIGGRGRYALWAVVLLRLLLPALPQSRFSVFNLARMSRATTIVQPSESANPQAAEIPIFVIGSTHAKSQATVAADPIKENILVTPQSTRISGATWIFTAWIGGILILSIRVLQVCRTLSRMTRNLPVVSDTQLLQTVQSCADTLHLRTLPAVLSGESVQTPAVVGLFKPKLLLPTHVLTQCSQREIRLIVMHELAHLKRHDIAGNWLIAIASIVHWFNPLVWLMVARMRADRELACDELVLAHCSNDAQAYGQTLVKLIEILSPRAATRQLVGILESTTPMQRRVRMIARFNPKQSPRWILTLTVLSALACVALTDAVRGDNKTPQPAVPTPPTSEPANVPVAATLSEPAPDSETKPVEVDYDITDLWQPAGDGNWDQGKPIIKLIESMIAPETWRDNGGTTGEIQRMAGSGKLIIWQTPVAQEKIAQLLKELRIQRASPIRQEGENPMMNLPEVAAPQTIIVSDADIEAANAKATTALKKKLPEVKFEKIPFTDVLDFLRETTGVNIVANWHALESVGVDKSTPISLHLKDVTFELVLSSVIRQLQTQDLAIVIDRGVITVTIRSEIPSYRVSKVYDVSDVATSEENVDALSRVVQGLVSSSDTVQTFNGKLIITTTTDTHEQIAKLLAELRSKPTTMPSK
jgi:beta-lactamase regulating signal transducer with metallopeptidase domain